MYCKAVGIILIVLSGGYCGLTLQKRYLCRLRMLEEFIMLLEQLKGGLRYQNYTIEENLLELRKSKYFYEFFSAVLDELHRGKRFFDAWEKGCSYLRAQTALKEEDIGQIERLGRELGISDLESQIGRINFYEEQLKQKLGCLNQEKREQCRLYLSLGLMGGMMAGIFLI